jgi:hypothetical protein
MIRIQRSAIFAMIAIMTVLVLGSRFCIEKAIASSSTPGQWKLTGSMNMIRDASASTLLSNGDFLVAGGFGDTGNILSSVEIYDHIKGTWSFAAGL